MGKSSVKSLELELEHQLTMTRFCLVIFLAIYAFGLAASDPEREEGLGALSNKVRTIMPISDWSNLPLVPVKVTKRQSVPTKPLQTEYNTKGCLGYSWIILFIILTKFQG